MIEREVQTITLSDLTAPINYAEFITDDLPTVAAVQAGLHEILAEQLGENAISIWLRHACFNARGKVVGGKMGQLCLIPAKR